MNNSETEYNEFIVKFAQKSGELRFEFFKMSEENQLRFASEAEAFLRQYNIAVNLSDIAKLLK